MPLSNWTSKKSKRSEYTTVQNKVPYQSSHFHVSVMASSTYPPLCLHISLMYFLHRSLTDIATISNYVHLRFLDISNNHLTDLNPLASLTQLLWLKASILYSVHLEDMSLALLSYILVNRVPWIPLLLLSSCRLMATL